MNNVCIRGVAWLMCAGLIVLLVAGCSSFSFGPFGKPKPEPTPEPTPKPQVSQPETQDVQSIIDNGKSQRKAGDYNKAIATFEEALKSDPENTEAATLLAETQQERATLVEEHMKKGLQYFSDENLQAAMEEWDAVLSLDPDHAKALEYKDRTQKQLDAFK
jgi:tetratricopeptide (TPR) repeat protein